ncbi:hypothetical protein COU61_05175 [Candidatus Pacearchaeota archaeon CG10_big_fil_rev_8_21_14_0_10_35_13]|nr:MAG: hypothetical protein COU61_05175 [Candidatus Pacearchaeota archaeon CG10_big_fil_rev_8_21_14_0_10_35_13]
MDPVQEEARYIIDSFGGGILSESSYGAHNFSAYIKRDFALRLLRTPINDRAEKNIHDIFRDQVVKIFHQGLEHFRTHEFAGVPDSDGENSCLLRGCYVPGNDTHLIIPGMDLETLGGEGSDEGYVEFTPHNIDTFSQASVLLANWLRWANNIEFAL